MDSVDLINLTPSKLTTDWCTENLPAELKGTPDHVMMGRGMEWKSHVKLTSVPTSALTDCGPARNWIGAANKSMNESHWFRLLQRACMHVCIGYTLINGRQTSLR